jgi:dihydrolipoamide dehydrogenase
VIGGQMLAHIASEEGKICVENMHAKGQSKDPSKVNYSAVPSCIFSFPEVATVGMTEEEAKGKEPGLPGWESLICGQRQSGNIGRD